MDAILSEVYSTVLPAAPFVIAAYVGVWLVIAVFVLMLWGKQRKTRTSRLCARRWIVVSARAETGRAGKRHSMAWARRSRRCSEMRSRLEQVNPGR